MEPTASRPTIPPEYGVPTSDEGLLPWSHIDRRMSAAMHYWLGTRTPAGTPQLRPVAGMWLVPRLYFGGSVAARWHRNLSADPRATIALEDAEKAVILEGEVAVVRPDVLLAGRLVEESNRKYDPGQKVEHYEGVEIVVFTPSVVFAWDVLYKDATRWHVDA